jgi:hypothetical protein
MSTIFIIHKSLQGHKVSPIRPEWSMQPRLEKFTVKSSGELHEILSDELCIKVIKFNNDMGWLLFAKWWHDILSQYGLTLIKRLDNELYVYDLIGMMGRVKCIKEIVELGNMELTKEKPSNQMLIAYLNSIGSTGEQYLLVHDLLINCVQYPDDKVAQAAFASIEWGLPWCLTQASSMYEDIVKLIPTTVAILKKTNNKWYLSFQFNLIKRLKQAELIKFYNDGILAVPNNKSKKEMNCLAHDTKPCAAETMGNLYDNIFNNDKKHCNKTCKCFCECSNCWTEYCSSATCTP